ncbi:tetratricopeptide repeat protein [Desulfosediminicola ganghwensis]|uniref:tetratricopeptide repeat protein n=1 Tax=Desulfosediminicola ganghwensis TaxID=2569540 RepID=UPI0010AC30BC|nr:tetratricopeptide repeat protein [Desulfosediminicola ganghwensis]
MRKTTVLGSECVLSGMGQLVRRYNIALCVSLLLVLLLTGGCSALQDKSAALNLERQIARQQVAREMVHDVSVSEKRSAAEYEELGDRYLLRRDISRAYLYYMRGLEIEPERVSLLEKQAALLLAKHKFFEAEIVYRKLLSINSASAVALEGLGKALFGQNKYDTAAENLQAALAITDASWAIYEYLGLIASHRQDFDLARSWFAKAMELQPDDETLLNNLAVSHYLNGDYKEALRVFSTLAKATDERKVHNNLALTYFKLGYYDQAMTAFKRGSKSEAEAYNSLGYQYLVNSQFLKAIKAFEKAIDLNPKYYVAAEKNLTTAQNAYAAVGGNL